ncbi:unnamed protein product [Triticum turgidum subsp. durum]|uniref:Uncharacterized protein n=1 Tax=Triticum turgidum subsp. durum TaxID=4567 RepID=A0A9R1PIL6_TRITD|nr:unnamed protein product [Triticum turgidum subsp. durum]
MVSTQFSGTLHVLHLFPASMARTIFRQHKLTNGSSTHQLILSGSEFESACSFLDGYLATRTFFVDYGLSIADIVMWSNLTGHHGCSIVISFIICCCLASQKKKARVISSFWIFSIITSSQSEPNI